MPTQTYNDRTFDARPDRIDLRDRIYQPKLISLPSRCPDIKSIDQYLPGYAEALVLDQGEEGACTGFGLAAVINFLLWKSNGYQVKDLKTVSPRMLYQMARIYDEWPGEDYEGSSCRGAMKGWHRHGICTDQSWPYRNNQGEIVFVPPETGWEQDAASRPLGAYYRIENKSVSDLQSAIFEVGAIYCSANVHKGWFMKRTKAPAIIPLDAKTIGGHAFALIGYTEDGFIVQNSWGPGWGYHGFAILGYEDWIGNGTDAWVAVMGAPMRAAAAPATFSTRPLQESAARPVSLAGMERAPGRGYHYRNDKVRPLTEGEAYLNTLVLGNNGLPINRIVSAENALKAVERVCLSQPIDWFDKLGADQPRKLAVYVHGGLNSEADSLIRIRMMAPYFRENGIYPLFVTWKTGALESIGGILDDSVREIFRGVPEMRDEGVADKVKEALADARDRSIEVACENLLVKPMWSEMKQNAAAAAQGGAGLQLLAEHLLTLKQRVPNLEIHLAGHSAGSLVLGHLFWLLDNRVSAASLTLFAPACSVEFANRHYGAAIQAGKLVAGNVHVDIMDDERERADTVGPYGKSLLYLVSRALETRHKTPLLGMEWAWKTDAAPQDQWSKEPGVKDTLTAWSKLGTSMSLHLHSKRREYVSTGAGRIKLAHGSFDNDVEVVSDMLQRIRGASLTAKVENLAY
jgi:hypothetical protein